MAEALIDLQQYRTRAKRFVLTVWIGFWIILAWLNNGTYWTSFKWGLGLYLVYKFFSFTPPYKAVAKNFVRNSTLANMERRHGNHIRGAKILGLSEMKARIYATQVLGKSGEDADIFAFNATTEINDSRYKVDENAFKGYIKIAGIPMPKSNENLHLAIAASTGAGKSVTLRGMLADIRARGDRAIVIDNSGEFMHRFAQDDDLILSPFDDRSRGWNVKNEVRAKHDWLRLSSSVIPNGQGQDRSWHDMAQKLFGNIGVNVGEEADNKTLFEIATNYTPAQLEPILAGSSSAVLTQEGGERLLTNIRSVYASTLQSWPFMKGGDFSLRDYMQSDDRRWLYLPFQESEFGVTKSLLATWMDVLVAAGLEREEGAHQTWLIIDELDTLGSLSSLVAATTKLRKRGVAVVVAFQSYSQLEKHYGEETALTLLNCFSNKFIMRSVDGDTAERLSKELGEREYWEKSYSGSGKNSGHTENVSKSVQRLVLASEIQNLPDLEGYLKLAGDHPVSYAKASL